MSDKAQTWCVDMEPGTALDLEALGVEFWDDLRLSTSTLPDEYARGAEVAESIVILATEARAKALEDLEGVIRVRPWTEPEPEPEPTDDTLVGLAEIAKMAGVQRETVQAWTERHASFPVPAETLAMGRVWWRSDIAAWLAVPRRPGRPRTTAR